MQELARASTAWQHVSAVDAVPWTRLTKEDVSRVRVRVGVRVGVRVNQGGYA